MARIRGKDTGAEMIVRRLVHSLGYRYRLHAKDLPGRPDLVFRGRHKVIFVHGCFWHQHQDATCKVTRRPKTNQDFWRPKFERNRARDARQLRALDSIGIDALVVWECETRQPRELASRLTAFLGPTSSTSR
jgi:DNA mismatch endonuclease, patch repair protein